MTESAPLGTETAPDNVGGYDFTPVNTVPSSASGRNGENVRDLVAANLEYLEVAAGSHPFNFWNSSWSAALWIKPTATPGAVAHISSVWKSDVATNRCWALDFSTGRVPRLVVSADGTTVAAMATWSSALTVDQWHHLSWGHDAEGDEIWIAVDNGTRVTTAHSTGTYGDATLAPFRVGAIGQGGNYLTAEVGDYYFVNKSMSTDEVLELYNS